ncbi:MAG TPA: PDZ domain-containing protein [Steroidobacteraceae bacterium]|nr:PDZ domain-containing protein [Steroidobacteraceae bacterium]
MNWRMLLAALADRGITDMRIWLALSLAFAFSSAAGAADRLLLNYPALSKTQIVFEYGGELWSVPRSGGEAHVLASGIDLLTDPVFSPDGSLVAFSGTYEKNTDVYVVPASGGQPRRLTYHPDPDVAVGFTPDGKNVLFRSHRYSFSDPNQLFTVPVSGGFPAALPLPGAETGSYSADGSHIAYVPGFQWEEYWKGYKGGQHTQIWIARLSDSSVVRIPNLNANENDPMWVGRRIYFLSDRDGPITLYAYDVDSGQVKRLIDNTGFDITSASAGPGGIVYSQFGELHIYDFATGTTHPVRVTVAGDLPQRRPYFADVADNIVSAALSPKGVRAVFEAHGDILTVPAKHGSVENLTHSPGAMDRDPAWSPDGKSIAYFSDRAGEYDLEFRAQDGTGPVRSIPLGQDDAFYAHLTWSPDSKKVFFEDQKLNLWTVDTAAAHPKAVKIATDDSAELHSFDASWSGDSRWIVYAKVLPNYLHALFVYDLEDGSTHQLTDGTSDCLDPAFDPSGKYLYFTSSTDTGLAYGWLDMSRMERPVTRQVYAATLRPGLPSPLAPRDGFEKSGPADSAKAQKPGAASEKKPKAPAKVSIDFKGLQSRAVPLPIPAANYVDLASREPGVVLLAKAPLVLMPQDDMGPGGPPISVLRFDLKTRKLESVLDGIADAALAANGEKLLFRRGKDWFISDTKPHAKPEHLDVGGMRVLVNPQEQWAQMYRDAWRIERAFFYNPTFDGLDIGAAEKEFAHYLPGIASRDDLSFLFREMMSYLSVGHMFIYGGYEPTMEEVSVGLLGADYRIENGHYRIVRIYRGGAWNPTLYAPLAQPGLKVKVGDYLLAVNGTALDASVNLYAAFQDLANKTVTLTVGPNPQMQGSHSLIVKTIPKEDGLRNQAWIERNARLVDRLSGGKLGYVYLPDTFWGGYTNFNRYYFSQVDKQGVIIDERFNHGGLISDYIIDSMERRPMAVNVTRWGRMAVVPPEAIFGPKVMVINQFSGSGGDALPWYFKMDHVGQLVGERTWGGLVGIGGYPQLMDGGGITAPRIAVEGLDGTFPVENHGVSPDVTVWQNPALVRQGHDPQLERAVQIAMDELKAHPLPHYQRPPWLDWHPKLPPLPPSPTSVSGG